MIHLSLNGIRNLAGNDRLFKDGFMIHQKELINDILPSNKHGFHLTMSSPEDKDFHYKTSVYFHKDTGTFKSSQCTCHMESPCKHTIAALLYILYQQDALSESLTSNQKVKMYESFSQLLTSNETYHNRKNMILEVTLHPRNCFGNTKSIITLKTGYRSLYLVKNIEAFVDAIVNNRDYSLSKYLTLEKGKYIYSAVDYSLIELLNDYYRTRRELTLSNYTHTLTPTNASRLSLTDAYLSKLLRLLLNHFFNLEYDGMLFKNQNIHGDVDVDFFVNKEELSYSLSVNTYDIFYPLTPDYEFVFYNNQISYLKGKTSDAFRLFYNNFEEKHVDIPIDDMDAMVSSVLPVLESIGTISMEPELEQRVINEAMSCHITIDKFKDGIALSMVNHYGPYSHHIYPYELHIPESLILRRNLEKEGHINALLKQPQWHLLDDGRLAYIEEDAVFEFIYTLLPKLAQLADVYYSEDFETLHVKSQKRLNEHIRFNHDMNLLELSFEMEDTSAEELRALLNAIIAKKSYFKFSDGRFFAIDEDLTWQLTQLDQKFGIDMNANGTPQFSLKSHNALFVDQLLKSNKSVFYDAQYTSLLKAIKEPDSVDYEVPKSLAQVLRPYQKTGFKWLKSLTSYRLGGILADDMGLGKTLQAISLMIGCQWQGPSLIVAPTSLIYNWQEEVHKFVPNMATRIIAGSKSERLDAIQQISDNELIITSYGSLKRDLSHYKIPFNFCFIDEAQHIKNPKSQNALAVKSIHSKHRFALTGTPIENNLTELWSIFDFILPEYLSSHQHFVRTYEKPIIKDNDQFALDQLSMLIRPFILRRLKEDVLDELPPKIETRVSVDLNTHQKKLYKAYVDQAKSEIKTFSNLPNGQRSMKILSILTRLRQICCHPSLFVDNYEHDSSKLSLLLELVADSLEGGHRLLIFSQFTTMLSLIGDELEKEHIDHFFLDGSIPPIKRQQMVHDFNNGINDVFLISLKAGGTGLNLTGADVVIHFDPWWNPAVENQATDRAYRIGQKKCVQVYKLVTTGTIEEKIYELQNRKKGLIDNVIKPGETFINKMSAMDLEQLFDT